MAPMLWRISASIVLEDSGIHSVVHHFICYAIAKAARRPSGFFVTRLPVPNGPIKVGRR